MALALHKILQDGSVAHEDFTRAAWERAMGDASLLRFGAHPPEDCHDPVERLREKLGRRVELVKESKAAPPAAEEIVKFAIELIAWPPETLLTPQFLSQMTGMCVDDCKSILAAPRRELPPEEVKPLVDKDGQLRLF
jgi:hypothetical protein